ncbi:hypothetical protein J3459_017592 [Metarhizium acridum]|uniref:Cell wall galactomannoprotein n=1 Tax=Metarhizium acridum (strain CQMa 102) TaxID=655827 RepID=E9EDT3_METAQ|nr:uncharacterized protein MAC_08031 [Metarhizium acridum CQMa 102]EFY85948.1 hypothetical protein MAC_08031 [Metarhizium acridum CQMa 102]KAG8409351.1 hypothetical protein J3459_017592 [Metarhizium acridum]KAG8418493.1 hypothetical protein J3458_005902 [Metarhizium acridum]
MKFAGLALLAIPGAHALVLPRDNALPKCLNDVTASINHLDDAARSFDGNITPVVEATDGVTATIQRCQTIVDNSEPIGLSLAVALLKPVQDLDKRAKNLFNDVKDKVDDVKKARQCGVTRNKLGALSSVGRGLTQTIVNKISSGMAKNIAKRYAEEIEKLLAKSQDLFAVGHCDDLE